MKADLKAAGIDYRDWADRVADFRSLRQTIISQLALSSLAAEVTQTLARRWDVSLTLGVYGHVAVHHQVSGIESLRSIPTTTDQGAESAVMRDTGTD
jgi:hypothetical protein